MFDLVVMGGDAVDDLFVFAMLFEKFGSNQRMRSFDLVVQSLPNVVKQTRFLCAQNVESEFRCHHAAEMGNLDGMGEDVLGETLSKFQATQLGGHFRIQGRKAGFEDCLFT